jgi:hypothetical protein
MERRKDGRPGNERTARGRTGRPYITIPGPALGMTQISFQKCTEFHSTITGSYRGGVAYIRQLFNILACHRDHVTPLTTSLGYCVTPSNYNQANLSRVANRTRISIGWLSLSWQEFPKTPAFRVLAVMFLPCISIQIIMMLGLMLILCYGQWPIMPSAYYNVLVQGFVRGDGGSER